MATIPPRWSRAPEPFEKAPFAHDRHTRGLRLTETFRGVPIGEERPSQATDHERIGLLGEAATWCPAVFAHEVEGFSPFHRGEPAGKCQRPAQG